MWLQSLQGPFTSVSDLILVGPFQPRISCSSVNSGGAWVVNRHITQSCLALASNQVFNLAAEHGRIRLVSITLLVDPVLPSWSGQVCEGCVELVWQSELAAQPLGVSFSQELNFVSRFALRMKQRKDILRSHVSRSCSAVLSVAELEQAMWSSGITEGLSVH